MSDYDFPKPLSASHAMEDYDYPRGGRQSAHAGPHEGDRSLSAVPSQLKRESDSSSLSQSSGSVYSADTSSGSLDSSLTGGRASELPGYDVQNRIVPQTSSSTQIRQSEVNLEEELKLIDGLMAEVAQQRVRVTPSTSSINRITLDGFEIGIGGGKHLTAVGGESKRSSSSMQESLSSRSGSNDTLGVWDDVSFADEEDSGESDGFDSGVGEGGVSAGSGGGGVGGGGGGVGGGSGQEGELLDSWIKELESGIQGMSEVAGVADEVSRGGGRGGGGSGGGGSGGGGSGGGGVGGGGGMDHMSEGVTR